MGGSWARRESGSVGKELLEKAVENLHFTMQKRLPYLLLQCIIAQDSTTATIFMACPFHL
jgi:hypothetical protein